MSESKMESKKYNLTFWLWTLFAVSVLFRFYLAMKTGVINTYHDEPLYWNISRALLRGESFMYRGMQTWAKDTLYPWAISVAHLFRDFDSVYHTMLLINALLMSSIVFPIYLLAKAVLGNPRQALFLAFIGAIVPELFYSAKLLQECLYYPYVLWMFWLFFAFLLKNKYSVGRVALFSALLCAAFYIKGIGYCLVLAFFLFYVFQLIFCGTVRQKLKSAFLLLESVGICLAVDHVVVVYIEKLDSLSLDKVVISYLNVILNKFFGYTNYSVVQLAFAAVAGIAALLLLAMVVRYCGKKLRPYRWSPYVFGVVVLLLLAGAVVVLRHFGYLRPFTTYVVYSGVFWGIFPVLLPLAYVGELSERERDFLLFLIALWLLTLSASCFSTLIVPDEVSRDSIRIHYRYFYYPAMGFLVLFPAMYKRLQARGITRIYVVCAVLCVLLLAAVTPAGQRSMVDAIVLYGMQGFLSSAKGILLLKCLMILYLLWGSFMLWKKHVKEFYIGVFLLLSCLYLASIHGVYKANAEQKQLLSGKTRDGERLAEYFADKDVGADVNRILIVGDSWINSTEATEVHLDVPYRYCLWKSLAAPEVLVNGELQGGLLALDAGGWSYQVEGYSPQYIVSLHPLTLANYETEQIGLEEYYLYVRSD